MNEKYYVAIVGSRDYSIRHAYKIPILVGKLKQKHGDNLVIVSGDALGIDKLAQECAKLANVEVEILPANWNRQPDGSYDKSAGMKRNKQIVDISNEGFSFWDLKSSGSRNTIELFRKANKKITIVNEDGKVV